MSSINGSCSQSHALIQTPNPLQQRLGQPQRPQAAADPASPAAPGNAAIQLASSLNAPTGTPAPVAEAHKGANIDIHV